MQARRLPLKRLASVSSPLLLERYAVDDSALCRAFTSYNGYATKTWMAGQARP